MLWPWKKREAGHLRAGRWGERQARRMLAAKGYRILGRRVRVGRRGELDIVARNGDTLVFVEVKTRRNEDFGRPIDAVDRAKQRRLSRAALGYLRSFAPAAAVLPVRRGRGHRSGRSRCTGDPACRTCLCTGLGLSGAVVGGALHAPTRFSCQSVYPGDPVDRALASVPSRRAVETASTASRVGWMPGSSSSPRKRRQVFRPTTGTPSRRAKPISERVP